MPIYPELDITYNAQAGLTVSTTTVNKDQAEELAKLITSLREQVG